MPYIFFTKAFFVVVAALLVGSGLTPTREGAVKLTGPERELQRIPHQTITTQQVYFSVRAEAERSNTAVSFYIQIGKNENDMLELSEAGHYQPVCLIITPLLASLTRPIVSANDLRLYPAAEMVTFTNITSKPLLADAAAARKLSLAPGSFQPLEDASSVPSNSSVVTTYNPPVLDGKWEYVTCKVDASAGTLSPEETLQWIIVRHNIDKPLLLGNVHINYQLHSK